MSLWWLLLVIAVAAVLTARRWLPDSDSIGDLGYDLYRGLVPAPRPTVRLVTRRIARACRRQRVMMPFGRKAVLPRAFCVDVHPGEFAVIEPLLGTVGEAVGASLVRTARDKQWLCAGTPVVSLQCSDQVAEGRPVVVSTVLPAPDVLAAAAPAALPRIDHEPTHVLPDRAAGAGHADPTEATGQLDLPAPEATSAREPIRALREYRLHSGGEEPDIVVRDRPVLVGRDASCQIVVGYPAASRRHLQIVPTAAGARVEDLGSTHGTLVNGRRIHQPTLLSDGDTLRLGGQGPVWTYGASQAGRADGRPGHTGGELSRSPTSS